MQEFETSRDNSDQEEIISNTVGCRFESDRWLHETRALFLIASGQGMSAVAPNISGACRASVSGLGSSSCADAETGGRAVSFRQLACTTLRNAVSAAPYREPAGSGLVQLLVPVCRAVGVMGLDGILTREV